MEAAERAIPLSHHKNGGEHGEIRLRILFTPEIIAKQRKNTSTFSTAGRTVTQIGSLPVGAGKGVIHGVGKVGNKVSGVLHRSKHDSSHDYGASTTSIPEEPPSGQVSGPVGAADTANGVNMANSVATNENSIEFPIEPGTLKVSVLTAKDLSAPDSDAPKAYVIVRCGEKEHKTKHASKSVTPEW